MDTEALVVDDWHSGGLTPSCLLAQVPIERLRQSRVEAEIAFVPGEDLVEGPLDVAQVRGAVAHAVAALEIVDSRMVSGIAYYGWPPPGAGAGKATTWPVAPPMASGPPQS